MTEVEVDQETDLELDLSDDVWHAVEMCPTCSNKYQEDVEGSMVETICGRMVRWVVFSGPKCKECVAKFDADFFKRCGICGYQE